MVVALGEAFIGVLSSPPLHNALSSARAAEYDHMWAMPLDEDDFEPQIYDSSSVELCSTDGQSGGRCTTTLFLKNFIKGLAKARERGQSGRTSI